MPKFSVSGSSLRLQEMGKTQASTSAQGGAVLGGSGATSHVYIQYPPLRCDIPGAAGVMYDDGNKLLLVPAPSKVNGLLPALISSP